MIDATKAQRLADEIYGHFEGHCVFMRDIMKYFRSLEHDYPPSTVKIALQLLMANGKLHTYEISRNLILYCFGREANFEVKLRYEKLVECIKKHMPSFRFRDIADCVNVSRTPPDLIPTYIAILYTLMQMMARGEIFSFTVLRDGKDRYKVITQR